MSAPAMTTIERAQRVQHLDGALLRGEHVRQPAIDVRALVEPAAAQDDALLAHPRLHHLAATPRPGVIDLPVRRFTLPAAAVRDITRPAPCTVEYSALALQRRRLRSAPLRALHDHRIVAHRAADEALLSGKRRRRALADDDERLAVVLLAPGEVVMVVHELQLAAAEQSHDLARHPLAAGVGVLARERHQRPVVVAHRLIEREQHLALGHARAPLAALRRARGSPTRPCARSPRLPKCTPTQIASVSSAKTST